MTNVKGNPTTLPLFCNTGLTGIKAGKTALLTNEMQKLFESPGGYVNQVSK